MMKPDYDKTIQVGDAALRVVVEGGLVKVYHGGSEVASRRGDLGVLMFQVTEAGQSVMLSPKGTAERSGAPDQPSLRDSGATTHGPGSELPGLFSFLPPGDR